MRGLIHGMLIGGLWVAAICLMAPGCVAAGDPAVDTTSGQPPPGDTPPPQTRPPRYVGPTPDTSEGASCPVLHNGVVLCNSLPQECLTLASGHGQAGLFHVSGDLYFCVVAHGGDSYCLLED